MRALLAVSAVHMAQHKPDQADHYLSHGILYHQIASRTAVDLLHELRPENCENLWIFSVFTIYFSEIAIIFALAASC